MENKKITTININDGFIEPVIKPEDYCFDGERSIKNKLGSLGVADENIKSDGQWDKDLPIGETQVKKFDTAGCTVFNSTNQIEIYEKALGKNFNYSDRGLYIMANVSPPGADPNDVYEIIRNKGLFNEEDLPWSDDIQTLKQYASPKPLPKNLIEKAKEWLKINSFHHEWLLRNLKGLVEINVIKENLTKSNLAVAVQAWSFDGEKYVRTGEDTHWTDIIGYKELKYLLIYDSYSETNESIIQQNMKEFNLPREKVLFLKKLDWNFGFRYIKRIRIGKALTPIQKQSIINLILSFVPKAISWIRDLFPEQEIIINNPIEIINTPPAPPAPPVVKPKQSKLIPFAKAIEIYENTAKWRKNPGAVRDINGKFLTFATYEEGFLYLQTYIQRVKNGKHLAYKKGGETSIREFFEIYAPTSDNNNPSIYAKFAAGRIGELTSAKLKDFI